MTVAVDASALVAILLDEPEKSPFVRRMLAGDCEMSLVGYWETAIRARQLHGEDGVARLDRLIAELGIRIAPASATTARLASDAERQYGKRTPAKLNLGECFAYALAREQGAPLLFVGDDFARTDIEPALKT
nr:type II toxin-antitoxin system VapC family toxin [uncultured Brevundimonas sp.]